LGPANSQERPPQLDYHSVMSPETPRRSRLAVPALLVALFCSPCILGPVIQRIGSALPGAPTWASDHLIAIMETGMAFAVGLSLAAVVRIGRSRGARSGMPMAVVGLCVSLLWWIAVGALVLTFRAFGD
jgi:hypothetical protein